jgi:hypothetical protein
MTLLRNEEETLFKHSCAAAVLQQCYILGLMSFRQLAIFFQQTKTLMIVEISMGEIEILALSAPCNLMEQRKFSTSISLNIVLLCQVLNFLRSKIAEVTKAEQL